MKTVTGRVISAEPISLSKAATILSGFVSSETETSQDVSAYLRRASAAFTELRSFHREIRSKKPKSEARHERNLTDEFEELSRAKGIDDSVENGEKIRSRESETVTGEESVHGREQEEVKEEKKKKKKSKENKEDVVEEKLEDEQRDEERKERKKKRKKNKGENVIDEKVDMKLEEEQWSEERKESKKKKKKKKNKEEDLIDEKVNVKVEEEQRSEERKKKKKRKSDGEIGSEERKSKKKRISKEIEG